MDNSRKTYPVYKGLQKPLVFKGFKGKFIYWGLGSIALGFILTVIVATFTSYLWGGLTLAVSIFGSLALTAMKQKKGLYNKKVKTGIYIVPNRFRYGKEKV